MGSSIARETDTGIYIHVGPEIGVASTKAFTGQVTVLTLLALGHELGTLNNADYYQIIEELSEIPQKMEKVLEQAPIIKDISRMFTYAHNFLYLGRGVNCPVAMEGALKLKEIADNVLEVPRTLNALVPLLSVVPLQLLAYYVAVDKGLDVGMPRNLAKSVTVE